MAQRSRLLDIWQGAAPEGVGEIAAPVGTDAIPTSALENEASSAAPEPPAAAIPGGPEAPPEEEQAPGIQALIGGPEMTPDARAELEAEIALAARRRLMEGGA
jgi:hypothetical protein